MADSSFVFQLGVAAIGNRNHAETNRIFWLSLWIFRLPMLGVLLEDLSGFADQVDATYQLHGKGAFLPFPNLWRSKSTGLGLGFFGKLKGNHPLGGVPQLTHPLFMLAPHQLELGGLIRRQRELNEDSSPKGDGELFQPDFGELTEPLPARIPSLFACQGTLSHRKRYRS